MIFCEGVGRWWKLSGGANGEFDFGRGVREEGKEVAVYRTFVGKDILSGFQPRSVVKR